MATLNELANLGPTIIRRLEAIGIHDRKTLAKIGPSAAYQALCAKAASRLPVCYYLYTLEGALRGVNWRHLSPKAKTRLRAKAGIE